MQIKSFITTMGIGIAAGAATVLMLPKNSKVYQAANDAANMIKSEATKISSKIKSQ